MAQEAYGRRRAATGDPVLQAAHIRPVTTWVRTASTTECSCALTCILSSIGATCPFIPSGANGDEFLPAS